MRAVSLMAAALDVAVFAPFGPLAALDVVQLDLAALMADLNSGAQQSTIAQDTQTLNADFAALVFAEQQFAQDHDHGMAALPAPGAGQAAAVQGIDRLLAGLRQQTPPRANRGRGRAGHQPALHRRLGPGPVTPVGGPRASSRALGAPRAGPRPWRDHRRPVDSQASA
jgi:hypothetical protein